MPQVSIVSGIYSNGQADYRQSYPVNYYPVVMDNGLSNSYLRQTPGVVTFAMGEGVARGAIEFNGLMYQVSGGQFIRVYSNGVVDLLGAVPGMGPVSLAKSIDRICIVTDGRAFYWTAGAGLVEITDPNFARAIDVIYVDGYFLFIDEQFVFNSNLSDPTTFNPLSFGSADVEGDPNVAIVKVRNEPHVCGRDTIEVFQNVGGAGFPFARIAGAMITKGVVGTKAAIEVEDALFFVGAGRGEAPSVYLGGGGQAQKIATDEIEKVIQSYGPQVLAGITCQTYSINGQFFIMINLPDQTLVYDLYGSRAAGVALWHIRKSGGDGYRVRDFTRVFGQWIVGDVMSGQIGRLDDATATEYSETVFREFTTPLGFVEGRSFILHEVSLYGLPGRTGLGTDPKVALSTSRNGVTYSQERWASAGKRGNYDEIVRWRLLGRASSQLSIKFRIANESFYTPARLEVKVEPLND
jgi:hypothetical protein